MTRLEFTKNICSLIKEMNDMAERPILDYVKRSDEEQLRLFNLGLSKCDGTIKISKHQIGRAADIYFLSEDGYHLTEPILGHEYWHNVWLIKYGGQPAIPWDLPHYEGK